MDFDKSSYNFQLGTHKGKPVIWIFFPNNQQLRDYLKQSVVAHWSQTKKAWYVRDVKQYRLMFGIALSQVGMSALHTIHPVNQEAYKRFIEELELRGYSPNTIKTYSNEFIPLLQLIKSRWVDSLRFLQQKYKHETPKCVARKISFCGWENLALLVLRMVGLCVGQNQMCQMCGWLKLN